MEPNSGSKSVLECDHCGDEFEKYTYRITDGNNFCGKDCYVAFQKAQAHYEPCANCGDDVQVPPSRQKDEYGDYHIDHHFCNKECESEWKQENWAGEDHPSWRGGDVATFCEECGQIYEVKRAKVEKSRFCSLRCFGEYQRNDLLELTCPVCEERFEREAYKVRGGVATCSDECYHAYLSELRTGENNPAWKGGPIGSYGGAWKRVRQAAIDRAGGQCELCGLTTKESEEKYGRGLHGHHITQVRSFDDISKAHKNSEILALCGPCHREAEQYAPLRPRVDMIAE